MHSEMVGQRELDLCKIIPGEVVHRVADHVIDVDRADLVDRLVADSGSQQLRDLLDSMRPEDLGAAVRDLGGHDLGLLVDTFRDIDPDRPTVVFAYTVEGRGLSTEGHPSNHSALLTPAQLAVLAASSGIGPEHPWQRLEPGTPAARWCEQRATVLARDPVIASPAISVPTSLGHPHRKATSTQAALGRLLADLTRDAPQAAARVVTCSPDVASSTNLGGWTNKTGVWSVEDRRDAGLRTPGSVPEQSVGRVPPPATWAGGGTGCGWCGGGWAQKRP